MLLTPQLRFEELKGTRTTGITLKSWRVEGTIGRVFGRGVAAGSGRESEGQYRTPKEVPHTGHNYHKAEKR